MKIFKQITLACMLVASFGLAAQETVSESRYGNTLNLGVGVGYYGYIGSSTPVLHANYEIGVARNFTIAPFITYFSYRRYNYWGNPNYPYRDYYYRQTVIPVGIKGSFYLDELFRAGSKWDFYLAGSLGFAIRKTVWESNYYGDTRIENGSGPLYLDVHFGTEYRASRKVGVFLDLSTGISTLGLAFHL